MRLRRAIRDATPGAGRTLLGAALVAAVVALAAASSAAPRGGTSAVDPRAVPDQANPARPAACRYVGWAPDDSASWAAQTFTPGVSGGLTDVVIPLRVRTAQPAIVSVTPVDANGRPVVATPLAARTLTMAETTTVVETTFSFPAPPRLQRGRQYAIVLSSPGVGTVGPTNYVAWQDDAGSSIKDPDGTPCGDGAYGGGRAWASNDGLGADSDFFFQTFVVPARRVTVVMDGAGRGTVQDASRNIDCGPTCSAEFVPGETVTLTASADRASAFAGWSGGGCTGTRSTCAVVVEGDVTVVATFARKRVSLRVRKLGAGTVTSRPSAIRCGSRCTASLVVGSSMRLAAKPARGWRFIRWGGSCRGRRPVCRLTISGPTAVAAIFAR